MADDVTEAVGASLAVDLATNGANAPVCAERTPEEIAAWKAYHEAESRYYAASGNRATALNAAVRLAQTFAFGNAQEAAGCAVEMSRVFETYLGELERPLPPEPF